MDQKPSVNEAEKEITAAGETAAEAAEAPEAVDELALAAAATEAFLPEKLLVSPSPHLHADDNSRSVMLDVCIALLPALVWGIYLFGFRVLTITLISIACAVASEYLYQRLMKMPLRVGDCSCIVTGLLLALNLPASVPLWMPALGAVFAIIVVKQLFGGIGRNFVNPALAARVFLFAWPHHMSTFPKPGEWVSPLKIVLPETDIVAGATTMATLKDGTIPTNTSLFNAILGYEGGCIGEVSALLLTAGFIYLLVRRVITWHIPVFYIGTVAVMTFVFSISSLPYDFALYEIFSGGLFLGAIFMATDYATSPVTKIGRVIYAIGCGLVTVFIRYFGGYPEGVSFAILIMNLFVWYIDRYTKPVKFGGAKNDNAK